MIGARCIIWQCGSPVADGEDLCAEHVREYRTREREVDRCIWCGRGLVTVLELPRGYCGACRERTPEERVRMRSRRRALEARRARDRARHAALYAARQCQSPAVLR